MVFTFWRMTGVQVSTRPRVGFSTSINKIISNLIAWDQRVIFVIKRLGTFLAVPIVAFLRWHFCSVTKVLLAAPFSLCHFFFFFQKVLKYLVLGVLRRFITIGPDLQAGRTTSTSPGLSAGHPTWAISHGEPFWSSNLQKAARGEGHLTLTGSEREY